MAAPHRPTVPPDRRPRGRRVFLGAAVVALLLVVALGFGLHHTRTADRAADPGTLVVREVIDGDTVEVALGSHTEDVRLIGIDTPETKHPTKPIGCYGPEASARTAELLPPGTPVVLERDREERDVYGRLLAYVVRRDDGLFVNLELLRGGYAEVLTIAPNTTHTGELTAAAAEARREGRGLWSACPGAVPSGP
jgi:micrococcal nuclease